MPARPSAADAIIGASGRRGSSSAPIEPAMNTATVPNSRFSRRMPRSPSTGSPIALPASSGTALST